MKLSKMEKQMLGAKRMIAGCLGGILLFFLVTPLTTYATARENVETAWSILQIRRAEIEKSDFIDIIKRIVAPMDEDCALYQKAVVAMENYYNGKASLRETEKTVQEVSEKLKQSLKSATDYSLSDAEKTVVKAQGGGTLLEEVIAFGQTRRLELSEDVDTVNIMAEWLKYLKDSDEGYAVTADFREYWKKHQNWEQLDNTVSYYLYLNYWFADWTDADAEWAKNLMLSQYKNLFPKEYTWEKGKDWVEKKVEAYLNDLEKLNVEIEQRIKKMEYELNEMRESSL